jgi:hypothetical protein
MVPGCFDKASPREHERQVFCICSFVHEMKDVFIICEHVALAKSWVVLVIAFVETD